MMHLFETIYLESLSSSVTYTCITRRDDLPQIKMTTLAHSVYELSVLGTNVPSGSSTTTVC